MDLLRSDFFRFSLQHSWYKHIDLSGATFWAYKRIGQQPRNGIHPEVTDVSGIHWWFSRRRPDNIDAYPFQAGPFLRGLERSGEFTYGIHIIVEDAGEDNFENWIKIHYPHLAHITAKEWSHLYIENPILKELFKSEQIKYFHSLVESIPSELLELKN